MVSYTVWISRDLILLLVEEKSEFNAEDSVVGRCSSGSRFSLEVMRLKTSPGRVAYPVFLMRGIQDVRLAR